MKRIYIGRRGVSLNEGGYFFTFYWGRAHKLVRVWFQPMRGVTLSKCWRY